MFDELVICGIFIYVIYLIFFDKDKTYKEYNEMLTPTMKFIGAAAANTYINADCNATDIGGMGVSSWAKRHCKKLLKSGWGIKTSEDLYSSISWLFNEGHNEECMELMEIYKVNPDSKEIKKKQRPIMKSLCEQYENQGILAWDICRVCNLAGWGYLAGLISYDEAIKVSVKACKVLQENYSSWDDMMNSYFLGLEYWDGPARITPSERKSMYNNLKQSQDSVYSIPWDIELSETDYVMPRKAKGNKLKLVEA